MRYNRRKALVHFQPAFLIQKYHEKRTAVLEIYLQTLQRDISAVRIRRVDIVFSSRYVTEQESSVTEARDLIMGPVDLSQCERNDQALYENDSPSLSSLGIMKFDDTSWNKEYLFWRVEGIDDLPVITLDETI